MKYVVSLLLEASSSLLQHIPQRRNNLGYRHWLNPDVRYGMVHRAHMPAATVIGIYAPYSTVFLNQRERDGAGSFVEIKTQEESLSHIRLTFGNGPFYPQGTRSKSPASARARRSSLANDLTSIGAAMPHNAVTVFQPFPTPRNRFPLHKYKGPGPGFPPDNAARTPQRSSPT